jgi:hypothetical protein
MKHRIKALAEYCTRVNNQTNDTLQNFNIDLEDERKKDRDFNHVFGMLRDLEGTHGTVIESLYKYKIED